MKVCPIVAAINKIYEGGLTPSNDSATCVDIHGNDVVCDDVAYYTNLRIIDLAHFEVTKPSLERCKEKFLQFNYDTSINSTGVIKSLFMQSNIKKVIQKRFIDCVGAIEKLEEYILYKINNKKMRPGKMSLPNLMLEPNAADQVWQASATELTNRLIDYINKMDIVAIINSPMRKFELISDIDNVPHEDLIIDSKYDSVSDYMAAMHKIIDFEIKYTKHAQIIEKHQCKIVRTLGQIIAFIADIIVKN